jgi:DNA-binding GntR family transcriptional regulator
MKSGARDSVYVRGFDAFSVPANATIIEQAVCKLRNAIMQGELRPGQKLIEAELCRSLDISRASLREALRALEAERLIELVPNRGPSVAKLGYEEVESIHEVWALLTGEAVADFTRLSQPGDLIVLEKALAALKTSIKANAPLDQLAATNTFFSTINYRCGNGILSEVVISLVSRINFLRAQALHHQGWGVLYAQEIESILAAIRDHNPDAARTMTRRHIASACAAAKQVASMAEASASLASQQPAEPPEPGSRKVSPKARRSKATKVVRPAPRRRRAAAARA